MNTMACYCERIQFHLGPSCMRWNGKAHRRVDREFGLPAKTTMALVRKSAAE